MIVNNNSIILNNFNTFINDWNNKILKNKI